MPLDIPLLIMGLVRGKQRTRLKKTSLRAARHQEKAGKGSCDFVIHVEAKGRRGIGNMSNSTWLPSRASITHGTEPRDHSHRLPLFFNRWHSRWNIPWSNSHVSHNIYYFMVPFFYHLPPLPLPLCLSATYS